MKRIVSLVLALTMLCGVLLLASCGGNAEKIDMASVKTIADLKGARIASQSGTFHETGALAQIKANVKPSTYPEFSDLLIALQSGAIDGYIAEEPTALTVCLQNDNLDYIHLKNNDTGFTATDAEVGIAVGLKTDSALREPINAILAEIPLATRMELMEQMVRLAAGETVSELALTSEAPAVTNGTLKVAMECAYQPFNWTEIGSQTVGAVPISGEGKEGQYANGYDVQIAQYIANKLGMKLEVYSIGWDSLIPAVQSGTVDAVAAGMSPTADREEEVDFTNVYYSSNLVVIYKK